MNAQVVPSANRPAWIPRAVLVGAWIAVALAHLSLPASLRLRTWPPGYGLLEVLACASLVHRALRPRGPGRSAWWLLAGAAFLDILNLALSTAGAAGLLAGTSSAQLLNLGTGLLTLAGVVSFPRVAEGHGAGWRRFLDGLIFASSLLFLLWVMGMQGALRSATPGMDFRVFLDYLNAALLGGGVVFITSGRSGGVRGPYAWLALSAVAWLVSMTCWTLSGLPSQVASQGWIVTAGCIPLFQGLAAWSPRSVEGAAAAGEGWNPVRLFPYLPMSVGIAALAWLLVWRPLDVTRETFALFLAMVVLLLLRMLLAIKDLQASRTSLEARVAERTRALEKAQETLLRTERLNAMATLGAGLAHDLNNLLGAIRNSAELMHLNSEEGQAPSPRELRRVLEASGKAGDLTRRLMAFGARDPGEGAFPAKHIAEALADTREILGMLLPATITLSIRVDPPLGPVRVEPAVLEQVLVNLVSNAKDAMPGGGEVAIRLHAGTMAGGRSAAILEVRDSGDGIPAELQEAIFDAFYTTKAGGRGTGLGLASVRGLMEALGGTVDVASRPGHGTTFRLAFPAP